ncbi:MAG TPA: hypothetical protein DCW90_12475 [Lachnospiraceae bacterium]|nr:non-ribosomal peptide synthetase [uncultured Lachnoclostridium sp.]HAU86270.1 hypothetical protein [Lachnospiraceae bacterium]
MDKLKNYILKEVSEKRLDAKSAAGLLKSLGKEESKTAPIAIVGMSVKLPQAENKEEFWDNIQNKISSIREYPKSRRDKTDSYLDGEKLDEDNAYQIQGYLNDISSFNPEFFGFSEAEGRKISPLHRMFLECAWYALIDAGYDEDKERGKDTIVYAANAQLGQKRYMDLMESIDGSGFIGNANSIMPSRLSFRFDMTGKSSVVDSACSSSLLAVNYACDDIREGKTDTAVVCGTTINILPIDKERVEMLESPSSSIRPFGDHADGTVWGEGVCAVVLKNYSKAVADNDRVYAVIKANGANNDGASNGITAPNMLRQKELFEQVWDKFHIDVNQMKYIEAHGTGTELGDPIEVKSLAKALAARTSKKQYCALGTCKGNIGHIIAASGLAGLIKCAMSLDKGEIPPLYQFEAPNRHIDFTSTPLYVCDEKIPISEEDNDFLIGIDSFGISGTNVHMVLGKPENKRILSEEEQLYRTEKLRQYEQNRRNLWIVEDFQALDAWNKVYQWVGGKGKKYYKVKVAPEQWFVKEHCVLGKKLYPASKALETIYTVAANYLGSEQVAITEFQVICPFAVEKETYLLIEEQITEENKLEVKLFYDHNPDSKNEFDRDWVEFSHAKCMLGQKVLKDENQSILEAFSGKRFHANDFTKGKIVYGDRWDCVTGKKETPNGRKLLIALDKIYHRDLVGHKLHPALMDMALNGMSLESEEDYLPFYLEKLEITRPIPSTFISTITKKADKTNDQLIFYDITLHDEKGTFAVIEDYAVKKVNGIRMYRNPASCRFEWKKCTWQTATKQMDLDNSLWLSQTDAKSCFGEELEGAISQNMIKLQSIQEEKSQIENRIREKSVESLILELSPQSGLSDQKICMETLAFLQIAMQQDSINQVIVIGKTEPFEEDKEPVLTPVMAAVQTLVRSANNEKGSKNSRFVCIEQGVSNLLLLDVLRNGTEKEVMVRKNGEILLPELIASSLKVQEEMNKEQGVYVLTGGTGGLGLELAKKLIEEQQTVVLVSRHAKEDKRLISNWKEGQKAPVYYQADVSSEGDMLNFERFLQDTYGEDGNIKAVYHLAGIADHSYLADYQFDEASKVLSPKINGTRNLLTLAQAVHAQKIVLFSSVSALIGTPGQSAYSAASAYLDQIARTQSSEQLKIISVQLPAVEGAGMAFDNKADYETAFKTMELEEFKRNLSFLNSLEAGVYCFGQLNYEFEANLLLAWNLSEKIRQDIIRRSRTNTITEQQSQLLLEGREDGAYTVTEKELAKLWAFVLGSEQVDIDKDFFDEGGNSIMAISIANAIKESFHKQVDISVLFQNMTVRELAKYLDQHAENEENKMTAGEKQESYALSGEQKRLYALQNLKPDSILYNLPIVFELRGTIIPDKIEEAFRKVIEVQDSLRTQYYVEQGEVRQRIIEQPEFHMELVDIREDATIEEVKEKIAFYNQPFDLASGILLRVILFRKNETTAYLMMNTHHIAADGYSMALLMKNFKEAYLTGACEPIELHYTDFATWEQDRENHVYEETMNYWVNQFSDNLPVLELPYDFPYPSVRSEKGAVYQFKINETLSQQIEQVAKQHKVTVSLLCITSFSILLSKLSYQSDIIIGMPYAGREQRQLQSVIGMFVHTLPIRFQLGQEISYLDFVRNANDRYLEDMKYANVSMSDILSQLNISRSLSHNPLYDVMFAFQNSESDIGITDVSTPELSFELGDVMCNSVAIQKGISKFDLTLEIVRKNGGYECSFEYNTDVFKKQHVNDFAASYVSILEQITENVEKPIADISVIGQKDKELILNQFNETDCEYSDKETIISLFEKQVKLRPKQVAVITDTGYLTYLELNKKANAVAYKLREIGVGPDDFVAIICQRSIDMEVGIFGILKSGAAYVPIAQDCPEERLRYMLSDSQAKAVLVYKEMDFDFGTIPCFKITEISQNGVDENPEQVNKPDDLAYMIYTSGTTGKPKGVMCHNRGLMNRIEWMHGRYPINSEDTILQKTTYTFDVSVWEIIWWAIVGAKVYMLVPGGEKDPAKICEAIETGQVTTMHFVPSMLKAFLSYLDANMEAIDKITSLRYVFASGEALKPEDVNEFYKQVIHRGVEAKLVNFYGPTEAAIDVTYYDCLEHQPVIPIGKPIANTKIYIMNGNCLCPIGVPGELCITGVGVARGYCGMEQLTKEKFVNNLFGEGTLYHTGDLARWMPDGNIEYMGRIDQQVKIHGFRIELGEIEKVIRKYPSVTDAVVIAKDSGAKGKYLCAYVIGNQTIDKKVLQEKMKEELPAYMIPSAILQIDEIPVTANGKLNQKALPEVTIEIETHSGTAKTEEEKVLLKMVHQVLGHKNVGIENDFFEVGGDSIKGIQLQSYLKRAKYELAIQDIYECSNLRELALRLKKTKGCVSQKEVVGSAPLLEIQRDFFEYGLKNPNYYNQEIVCTCKERIQAAELERALKRLVAHHDALRMIFTDKEQINRSTKEENLYGFAEYHVVDENPAECIGAEHKKLNIFDGPVFRCVLLHLKEEDIVCMIAHHLICDGVTWNILVEDLQGLYLEEMGRKQYELPLKTNSYQDWTRAKEEEAKSLRIQEQAAYWRTVCKDNVPKQNEYTVGERILVTFNLNEDVVEQVQKNLFKIRLLTWNDVLLFAYARAAKRNAFSYPECVMLESHGRKDNELDVSRTAGWFTVVYPFCIPYSDSQSVVNNLVQIKEEFHRVPDEGIGFDMIRREDKTLIPSNVIINYIGNLGLVEKDSLFKISDMIYGPLINSENRALYDMELNVFHIENAMKISLAHTLEFTSKQMEVFMEDFKESIEIAAKELASAKKMSTPLDYGYNHLTLSELENIKAKNSSEIRKIYALSPMQKNILTTVSLGKNSEYYYERFSFRIAEKLDLEKMRESFELLVRAHDVFKTSFHYKGLQEPVQIVLEQSEVDFHIIEGNQTVTLEEILEQDKSEGFDLEAGKLIRMTIVKQEDGNYIIFSFHHIILDGWCLSLVLNEFFENYFMLLGGIHPKALPEASYSEYIRTSYKIGNSEALQFWKEKLKGIQSGLDLPVKKKNTASEYIQGNYEISVDEATVARLRTIANDWHVTESMVLQCAWGILLSQLSGMDDVVFGYVVSGRDPRIEGINQMLGLFINTLPMSVRIDPDRSVRQLVEYIKDYQNEAQQHCFLSISDIVQKTGLNTDIIDYAVVFENYPVVGELDFSKREQSYKGFTISDSRYFEQSTLGLSLKVIPGDSWILVFRFNMELYLKDSIVLMGEKLNQILVQISEIPEVTLGEFIDTESDRMDDFNDDLELE